MRLVNYLKPFHLTLGLVLFLVIIYTFLGLLGPYLMGVAMIVMSATKIFPV